jgi:hypothetical protein
MAGGHLALTCFNFSEFITAAKDIVLAVAGLVTAFVALKGLNTWNRQLRGTAGFDVARSLAKSSYKVRDKLQACRSPILSAGEFPIDYHDGGLKKTSKQKTVGYAFVYKERWNFVQEAIQEFDAATLEAEALWGQAIRETTDQLRKVVFEVNMAIEAFILNASSDDENFIKDKEYGQAILSKVSASSADSMNSINLSLALAIKAIDDQLLPHLQRT